MGKGCRLSVWMEMCLSENSASWGKETQVFNGCGNVSREIQGLKMNKGFKILLKKYSSAHLLINNILTYIDFPT